MLLYAVRFHDVVTWQTCLRSCQELARSLARVLISHQAKDKNVPFFEPPAPGDPLLIKKWDPASPNAL
jgi:hypothetical protein